MFAFPVKFRPLFTFRFDALSFDGIFLNVARIILLLFWLTVLGLFDSLTQCEQFMLDFF